MKNKVYLLLIVVLLAMLPGCSDTTITEDDGTVNSSSSNISSNTTSNNNSDSNSNNNTNTTTNTTTDNDNSNHTSTNDDNSNNTSSNGTLQITGKVTYDRVHVNSNGIGLNYNNITQEPAKQVVVKAIGANGQIISTTTADDNGNYILNNIPKNTQVKIRVYAQLKKAGTGGWDVKVVDNTNGDAQYVIEGSLTSTGNSNSQRNLNANSGWNGYSYSSTRAAAPFAILGSIYQAIQKVKSADSSATFPPLVINWSKNNIASGDGSPTALQDGQIGTSHFNGTELYILGDANSDTDEYDDHVMIHEWGHYFEANFSRADSIGGSHGNGEELDIRVAFGEGWGNAWSAIATDNPIYFDTMGYRQSNGFFMNIETQTPENPGWYSEASIQRILYDLYDSHDDGADTLSMGFEPIYNVLIGPEKTTPAFTSIFTFITYLKEQNPSQVTKIDNILASENIESIQDIYGSTIDDTLYLDMINGEIYNVETSTVNGIGNKLGNHRYIKFSISSDGTYTITVRQVNSRTADPDFALYQTAPFSQIAMSNGTEEGIEENSYNLQRGNYLLDISDYSNLSRAYFNVTIQ